MNLANDLRELVATLHLPSRAVPVIRAAANWIDRQTRNEPSTLAGAFAALMDEVRAANPRNSCLLAFGDGELADIIADALATLSPEGELRHEVVEVLADAFSEASEALP